MNGTKRIIKNSLMLYAVMFLSIITSIYTSRLLLTTLGVDDFGLYSLIGGLVVLFTFINGSMSGSIQRFLSASLGEKNIAETTEYFNASIIVHMGLALLCFALGKTVGEWVLVNKLSIPELRTEAAYWVFQATLIFFALQILSTPAQAMLTAYERMGALALITFLTPLGRLISISIAGTIKNCDTLILFAAIIMIVSLLQLVLFYLYALWKCNACKFLISRDKTKYKELTGFAGWGLFGNLAHLTRTQGTSILLNLFFSTVANASYGISNQLIHSFKSLSSMVTRAANPQIIKSFVGGDKNRAFKLVTQLSKVSFSILFVFALPFLFETEWILTLWLKEVPEYAPTFVQWAIVVALLEVGSVPLTTLSRATGKIRLYQAVVGSILLSIIPIAFITLKIGGKPESVYYVFLIAALAALCARLIILKRTSGIPVLAYLKNTFFKALIVSLIVVIIAVIPAPIFNEQVLFLRIYHVIGVPLIAMGLVWFFMITKSERNSIVNLIWKK